MSTAAAVLPVRRAGLAPARLLAGLGAGAAAAVLVLVAVVSPRRPFPQAMAR